MPRAHRFGGVPLPVTYSPALIAFDGDSIIAAARHLTATAIANHAYGIQSWLMAMLGQRARTDHSLNFGVAGDTTAMVLARAAATAACAAHYVVDLHGTNNVNGTVSATTLADYKANRTAYWDRMYTAGKTVITVPPLPRGIATASNRKLLHAMRRWTIQQQWKRKNFYVADAGLEFGDPLSTTYAPRANYTYGDNLHPQSRGAYAIALALFRVFDRILPPVAQFLTSVDDTYDAVYNATGNLLTNGMLDGTGGTAPAGSKGLTVAASPQMATGWSLAVDAPYLSPSPLAGLTVAVTKGTAPDGRPEQILTFTGSYTGDVDTYFGISQAITSLSRISAGDTLEAMVEIVLDPSASELPFASPRLSMSLAYASAPSYSTRDFQWVANGFAPKEGYTLLLRTPRIIVPQTPTICSVLIGLVPNQGANTLLNNAVLRIRSASVHKVTP